MEAILFCGCSPSTWSSSSSGSGGTTQIPSQIKKNPTVPAKGIDGAGEHPCSGVYPKQTMLHGCLEHGFHGKTLQGSCYFATSRPGNLYIIKGKMISQFYRGVFQDNSRVAVAGSGSALDGGDGRTMTLNFKVNLV